MKVKPACARRHLALYLSLNGRREAACRGHVPPSGPRNDTAGCALEPLWRQRRIRRDGGSLASAPRSGHSARRCTTFEIAASAGAWRGRPGHVRRLAAAPRSCACCGGLPAAIRRRRTGWGCSNSSGIPVVGRGRRGRQQKKTKECKEDAVMVMMKRQNILSVPCSRPSAIAPEA